MTRRSPQVAAPVLAALTLLAVLLGAGPAGAVPRTRTPAGTRSGSNTEVVMSGTGPGQAVTGLIADPTNPFDPTTGYPSSDPTTGFTPLDEGFAGVIYGRPAVAGPALTLYCIDIRTNTFPGVGYGLGTWDESNVPNVGYVAQILDHYYPKVPDQPVGLSNNQRAAAVQAAIWFFSDSYVVRTADPIHGAVVAIVDHVLSLGPVIEPQPPSVTITPSAASGPAGSVIGPFTVVSGTVGDATVAAVGAQMYRDAAATLPIADGATVPSGARIWLRSTGPSAALLSATADATVPTGNVYLYDGNSGLNDAQRLILSATATLRTTVSATADFLAPGSLLVRKTIRGPAAGQQGAITLHAVCNGKPLTPDFSIAAGAPAETVGHVFKGVPAGSVCTVTETSVGQTDTVVVHVDGSGQEVTVPVGGSVTADLVDTYDFTPGSLVVHKTIEGPAAGHQGAVTIRVVCDGTALTPVFVIPAGTPAGPTSHTYPDVPGEATCTVTETADGGTREVAATGTGSGQRVMVPAGGDATAELADSYDFKPGSLVVTKTISGPSAGDQGQVTIKVVCAGTSEPDVVIPAKSTGTQSHTYTGLPGNATCTVTETQDGSTSTVAADVVGSGQEVRVPPGGTTTADLTDTYSPAAGSLVVRKTIVGGAAGSQGEVVIQTVCGGTPLRPELVIPAGTPAGDEQQTYTGLTGGTSCTVTETSDGSTRTVDVTVTGNPQTVDIPAGGGAEANLTDAYEFAPGALTVSKTITGSAADRQGPVTIGVICTSADGEAILPDFTVPGGTAARTVSHTYPGIRGGSTCLIGETADGSTATVSATVTGSGRQVTIPPGGTTTADLTDSFALRPGWLLVQKTITGAAAGFQGPVTVVARCAGAELAPITIPSGAAAGVVSRLYSDVPANASCTVSETADGATNTVVAAVQANDQTVTVGPGSTVPVGLRDIYTDAPGYLRATKVIQGTAAGEQGEIRLLVLCGAAPYDKSFLIPAGMAAGTVSRIFQRLPAGATCTLDEVGDGHSGSVAVTATGSQQGTVPAGGLALVGLTDTYTTGALPFTGEQGLAGLGGLSVASIGAGGLLLLLTRRRGRRGRSA